MRASLEKRVLSPWRAGYVAACAPARLRDRLDGHQRDGLPRVPRALDAPRAGDPRACPAGDERRRLAAAAAARRHNRSKRVPDGRRAPKPSRPKPSRPQSLWFHDPDTREQRVALLIVLAVALPAVPAAAAARPRPHDGGSLLCRAAIFGVVLAEWLSEARDVGSPWHNVRRGVDCAIDEPMLTIRAATAFMFT